MIECLEQGLKDVMIIHTLISYPTFVHFRHGVESHALTLHGLKLEGDTKGKGGKPKNSKQNRKPRKVIKEESFSSDNSSEVEVKTRVIIQPKKKKSKVETVDSETAQCMSMLPEFNPKVVLRDFYLFNETSYQLPEKAETQERVEEPESKKEFVRRIRNQSQSSCKKIKIEADHDDEPSCSWSGWPRPPSTCKKSEDSDSDDIVCLN